MDIRQLPLVILKAIKPYFESNANDFQVGNNLDYLFTFVDANPESKFYFGIKSLRESAGVEYVTIVRYPTSDTKPTAEGIEIKITVFGDFFEGWLSRINAYKELGQFIVIDPAVKKFQEYYYSEFELVDDPSNNEVLNPNQILAIDSHLEYLEEKIKLHLNESNKDKISEIQQDVQALRDTLTTQSKKSVLKSLTKVWGKVTKAGVKITKDVLTDLIKEEIKKIIANPHILLEHVHSIIHSS